MASRRNRHELKELCHLIGCVKRKKMLVVPYKIVLIPTSQKTIPRNTPSLKYQPHLSTKTACLAKCFQHFVFLFQLCNLASCENNVLRLLKLSSDMYPVRRTRAVDRKGSQTTDITQRDCQTASCLKLEKSSV